MKNKLFRPKTKKNSDFRHFKNKIFFRTVLMILIAGVFIFLLYSCVLSGKFADWMIGIYQNLFRLDYDAAYTLYQYTFRNYMDVILIAAVVGMFLIGFRFYLNWFTVYFEEIGKGMDSLLQEKSGDVSLSSELLPLERRLNTVKHTIEKQKNEILVTEKRKNDLIMYLAHDLKTPLASVIGYLNLMRDEKEISDEVREKYLSISLEKAERLEELINEFFEIARFNLSDISLQYSRISLTRLLEQVLYEFDPMLKEKGLTGKLTVDGDVALYCDADKIQRVFDNLLRNAVMYSDEGGTIEITVGRMPFEPNKGQMSQMHRHIETAARMPVELNEDQMSQTHRHIKTAVQMPKTAAEQERAVGQPEGDAAKTDPVPTVTVCVLNDGDTIPEEKLERIFEQFYRLDDARGTKSGGAGLGLAIAKQIVELHGGSIRAQSREGRTKFCVTLPVLESKP